MDLFTPSKRILEAICSEEDIFSQHILIQRNSSPSFLDDYLVPFYAKVVDKIGDFYRLPKSESRSILQNKMNALMESVKNAVSHGNKRRDIDFWLFLGDRGFLYGIRDGGKYFRSKKVKAQWENKQSLKKFKREVRGLSGSHTGVNDIIFPYTDIIEVDVKKGIFYGVHFRDSFGN